MRKPAHAKTDTPVIIATVFERDKRHQIGTVEGTDPSRLAKLVSEVDDIPDAERRSLRTAARKAIKGLIETPVANLTDAQFDLGGRRLRVKIAA